MFSVEPDSLIFLRIETCQLSQAKGLKTDTSFFILGHLAECFYAGVD
jgi:hypothetical protein